MKEFFNLTYGGYLAGTIPILFVRSSSISVLRRFCLEHVRIMRLTDDFGIINHVIIIEEENTRDCR